MHYIAGNCTIEKLREYLQNALDNRICYYSIVSNSSLFALDTVRTLTIIIYVPVNTDL